ncbi:hypothetical protein QCA50_001990 [Cerrena zonata]|uniref:Uncharacterized protein n=1 Tax=Cerrena zonata TaxID=2478898 RepID=A0AAW0GSA0_9APHY
MSSQGAVSPHINPLLAKYLTQLALNPLRTKVLTSGVLQFLQDVLASHLAGTPSRPVPKDAPEYAHALSATKIDLKTLKMTIYGAFVSAPLNHYLVGLLQKTFAGKTDLKAKIGQILASNFLVTPIQVSVFLASMAIINGAKSTAEVIRTVKAGFSQVVRIQWMVSPIALVLAQKFIPPQLWVPYFNFIGFVMGTYFNTKLKKARLTAEANKRKEQEDKDKTQ